MADAEQQLEVVEDVFGEDDLVDHLGPLLAQSIHGLVENGQELSQQFALLFGQICGYGSRRSRLLQKLARRFLKL